MMKKGILPLSGVIQEYAWGGREFLADFTARAKEDDQPWAELWLGAHPKGPAATPLGPLDELLEKDGERWLGPDAANNLPFLLKVLDVRKMLSIQVHPDKAAAETGFAKEERLGPERNAPNRNYRDDNHKPELGVAITDFYLLHGFKVAKEIERTLIDNAGWSDLLPVFENGGVAGLYAHVMRADQSRINAWLTPLAEKLSAGEYLREEADFWAKRAFRQYSHSGDHDRGIFSIYWFNLLRLRPGEGIFQAAGIPHAYLEGVCVELMANSDNVLRGGLTPKHIDVEELLNQLDFSPVSPRIIQPQASADGLFTYDTPAPDFQLSKLSITSGEEHQITENQVAIYLLFKGSVKVDGLNYKRGQSFLVAAGQDVSLTAGEKGAIIYRATLNH